MIIWAVDLNDDLDLEYYTNKKAAKQHLWNSYMNWLEDITEYNYTKEEIQKLVEEDTKTFREQNLIYEMGCVYSIEVKENFNKND